MKETVNVKHLVKVAKCERFIKRLDRIKRDIKKGIKSEISLAAINDAVEDFEHYLLKMNYKREFNYDDKSTLKDLSIKDEKRFNDEIARLNQVLNDIDKEMAKLYEKLALLNNCQSLNLV